MKRTVFGLILILFFALCILLFHFRLQIADMIESPELIKQFLLLHFKNLFALVDLSFVHVFIDLGIVLFVLGIEYFVVGWQSSSLKKIISFKSKSLFNDVFYFVLSLALSLIHI
jgi:hypothetical protein